MTTKQTAVEFYMKGYRKLLIEYLEKKISIGKYANEHYELFKQAIEMHKEQITEARDNGIKSGINGYGISSEQYYNETYKQLDDEN